MNAASQEQYNMSMRRKQAKQKPPRLIDQQPWYLHDNYDMMMRPTKKNSQRAKIQKWLRWCHEEVYYLAGTRILLFLACMGFLAFTVIRAGKCGADALEALQKKAEAKEVPDAGKSPLSYGAASCALTRKFPLAPAELLEPLLSHKMDDDSVFDEHVPVSLINDRYAFPGHYIQAHSAPLPTTTTTTSSLEDYTMGSLKTHLEVSNSFLHVLAMAPVPNSTEVMACVACFNTVACPWSDVNRSEYFKHLGIVKLDTGNSSERRSTILPLPVHHTVARPVMSVLTTQLAEVEPVTMTKRSCAVELHEATKGNVLAVDCGEDGVTAAQLTWHGGFSVVGFAADRISKRSITSHTPPAAVQVTTFSNSQVYCDATGCSCATLV